MKIPQSCIRWPPSHLKEGKVEVEVEVEGRKVSKALRFKFQFHFCYSSKQLQWKWPRLMIQQTLKGEKKQTIHGYVDEASVVMID
ncbi:unnamed protein product [Citrullus colocynthis]|uniref:Uncharacterized protein n=1 Tax=Citrullus colocynthis TaxID=252529 RepID=A0ABP0Y591_9ROSI